MDTKDQQLAALRAELEEYRSIAEASGATKAVSENQKLREQVGALRSWKESSMEVMNKIDLQAIGKELGLRLGADIGPNILPQIVELKIAHARYEYLRKLNVQQFADLFMRNIRGDGQFDELVDQAIRDTKNEPI